MTQGRKDIDKDIMSRSYADTQARLALVEAQTANWKSHFDDRLNSLTQEMDSRFGDVTTQLVKISGALDEKTQPNWHMLGIFLACLAAMAGYVIAPLQVSNSHQDIEIKRLHEDFQAHENLAGHPSSLAEVQQLKMGLKEEREYAEMSRNAMAENFKEALELRAKLAEKESQIIQLSAELEKHKNTGM